jgi:hypothetical protein
MDELNGVKGAYYHHMHLILESERAAQSKMMGRTLHVPDCGDEVEGEYHSDGDAGDGLFSLSNRECMIYDNYYNRGGAPLQTIAH